MLGLTREGMKRFAPDAALYIRPMYWAEAGRLPVGAARSGLDALPAHALRDADAAADRLFRHASRPIGGRRVECMPTDAKAGCLYPEQRARHHGGAGARFRQCLVRDMLGNVAETGTSNVFMVKDGVVLTPAPNRSFLAGITRRRMIGSCARRASRCARRRSPWRISSTPTRFFPPATIPRWCRSRASRSASCSPARSTRKARRLYWEWAHA